ncbi:MAG TPA: peptidylprolyl isomerase [Spirochaetia bacterium]|nr:peptidylprolyl isomerase [Spirochaetia bacterium]
MRINASRGLLAAALLTLASSLVSCQQTNLPEGLYARMKTTKGEVLVKLDFERAPLTVGNFVGLAEGSLDAQKGKRFYDGLTFHRVVPDFVVQGGDPAGNGSGGPGYEFADEFSPELRHDGPGVLSMANAGPGTNGSQFFITLKETPWLDGRHSVFGKVVEGMEVVKQIAQGDKIEKVEIVRSGGAAKAFKSDQKAFDERAAKAMEAAKARAAAARATDLAFIEKNMPELKKGEDGIFQRTVKQGSGAKPAKGQTVAVMYKGMLLDGRVFDQSALHGGPLEFRVGAGEIIPGWDMVVQTMAKGEKRLVVLPPELAYGEQGAGGVIPPNAFLVFEMELIDIVK